MHEKYKQLFIQLARAAELLAEQVASYDHSKDDKKGEETALTMRDNYGELHDRMSNKEFDFNTLTKNDYLKLYFAALIVNNNIEEQIKAQEKVAQGYKIDVMPKLQRIVEETKTDEEVAPLANEIFAISDT